jgi:hypothetical protein
MGTKCSLKGDMLTVASPVPGSFCVILGVLQERKQL